MDRSEIERIQRQHAELLSSMPLAHDLKQLARAAQLHRELLAANKTALQDAASALRAVDPTRLQVARQAIQDSARTLPALAAARGLAEGARLHSSQWLSSIREGVAIVQEALRQLPAHALQRLLEAASEPEEVVGILETEESASEAEEEEQSGILLPERVSEALVRVEFFPVHAARRIASNPGLLHELSPRKFEEFTAYLVEQLGFTSVHLTPAAGDEGRDVVAARYVNEIPILFAFECKKLRGKVQLHTLRGLLGTVVYPRTQANIGVLVTTASFTKGCREFILTEPRIDGKDFDDLVRWMNEYL